MKQLSEIKERLQQEDALSVQDILKMDMYEYYRELNQRAWDLLKVQD